MDFRGCGDHDGGGVVARVGDLDGHQREGVYLNADGLRDLIRQLHGIVLLLDEMSGHDGHLGNASAEYGKNAWISGSGYLVDRNTADRVRDAGN